MNIKNIVQSIKNEFLYQIHLKEVLLILIVMLMLSVLNTSNLISKINSNYNNFVHVEQSYKNNGVNIGEYLSLDKNKNMDNMLYSDFVNLSKSIDNIKPKNMVSNMLEYSLFAFLTFIFGVYGVHMSVYDFKNNTIKNKIDTSGSGSVIVGKNISAFIIIFILLFTTCVLTYLSSMLLPTLIGLDKYTVGYTLLDFDYGNNILLQFVFSYLVLCLYFSVGFCLGCVMKNMAKPVSILAVYGFLIPVLSKYDLRNIISYLSQKIFAFQGNFQIFKAVDVAYYQCVLILLCIFVFTFIIDLVSIKKVEQIS